MRKVFRLFIILLVIAIMLILIYKLKEPILKKIYVIKYDEYIEKYSQENDIDKYLTCAIIKAESNFNEKAVSNKGAKGLMQIMDSTSKDIAKSLDVKKQEDILNPEVNIKYGTKYISTLIKKYENTELALAAYNAGSGKVDGWIERGIIKKDGSNIENIPYKETKNYVRKIINDYEIYKQLYQGQE